MARVLVILVFVAMMMVVAVARRNGDKASERLARKTARDAKRKASAAFQEAMRAIDQSVHGQRPQANKGTLQTALAKAAKKASAAGPNYPGGGWITVSRYSWDNPTCTGVPNWTISYKVGVCYDQQNDCANYAIYSSASFKQGYITPFDNGGFSVPTCDDINEPYMEYDYDLGQTTDYSQTLPLDTCVYKNEPWWFNEDWPDAGVHENDLYLKASYGPEPQIPNVDGVLQTHYFTDATGEVACAANDKASDSTRFFYHIPAAVGTQACDNQGQYAYYGWSSDSAGYTCDANGVVSVKQYSDGFCQGTATSLGTNGGLGVNGAYNICSTATAYNGDGVAFDNLFLSGDDCVSTNLLTMECFSGGMGKEAPAWINPATSMAPSKAAKKGAAAVAQSLRA